MLLPSLLGNYNPVKNNHVADRAEPLPYTHYHIIMITIHNTRLF